MLHYFPISSNLPLFLDTLGISLHPVEWLRLVKNAPCLNLYSHVEQSTALANQFKPAILQCFGDIAGAIGGHFETYLSVVAQVLQQAANVQASPDGSYEMFDYVVSLREGIMDAWGGIIGAMKTGGKSESFLE
jgi:hypothetical protein